jgi:hypothetical protein
MGSALELLSDPPVGSGPEDAAADGAAPEGTAPDGAALDAAAPPDGSAPPVGAAPLLPRVTDPVGITMSGMASEPLKIPDGNAPAPLREDVTPGRPRAGLSSELDGPDGAADSAADGAAEGAAEASGELELDPELANEALEPDEAPARPVGLEASAPELAEDTASGDAPPSPERALESELLDADDDAKAEALESEELEALEPEAAESELAAPVGVASSGDPREELATAGSTPLRGSDPAELEPELEASDADEDSEPDELEDSDEDPELASEADPGIAESVGVASTGDPRDELATAGSAPERESDPELALALEPALALAPEAESRPVGNAPREELEDSVESPSARESAPTEYEAELDDSELAPVNPVGDEGSGPVGITRSGVALSDEVPVAMPVGIDESGLIIDDSASDEDSALAAEEAELDDDELDPVASGSGLISGSLEPVLLESPEDELALDDESAKLDAVGSEGSGPVGMTRSGVALSEEVPVAIPVGTDGSGLISELDSASESAAEEAELEDPNSLSGVEVGEDPSMVVADE